MLGRLLGDLVIRIRGDMSQLSQSMTQAVSHSGTSTQQIANQWQTLGSTIGQTHNQMSGAMQRHARILDQYGRSVGQARGQMVNLGYQLNDIFVSLSSGQSPMMVLVQQGSQVQQIYGQGGGLSALFTDLSRILRGLARFAWPIALIGAAFAELNYQVQDSTTVAVEFGDTFKAVFQVAGMAIWEYIKGPVAQLGVAFRTAMDAVVFVVKEAGNFIIGIWVAQFKIITGLGSNLATTVGKYFRIMANGVLDTVTGLVNGLIELINGAITAINGSMSMFGGGGLEKIKPITIPFRMTVNGGNESLGDLVKKSIDDAFGRDYMGEAFEAIRSQAIKNALSRIKDGVKDVGTEAKEAAVKIREMADPIYDAAKNLSEVFGNAFERTAETGKFVFTELLRDVNSLVIRSVSVTLQTEMTNMMTGFIKGFSNGASGSAGNTIGNLFSGLLGGGWASTLAPMSSAIPGSRPAIPTFGGGVRMPGQAFFTGEYGVETIGRDGPAGAWTVRNAGETRNMARGSSSAPVTVNFVLPQNANMKDFYENRATMSHMVSEAVTRSRRFS